MTLPATQPGSIAIQYQDVAGDWQNFGPPLATGTIKRTRRFGIGPRQSITAQKWRAVKVSSADFTTGVMELDAIAFWAEGADMGPVRLYPFDFDIDTQRYVLVSTPGNMEVYRQGARVGSIRTPYAAAQVRPMTKAQVLDTFLGFHVDVAPLRITRQGGHGEWDSRSATFTVLPVFDYTGERAGGVNDVQQIKFDSYVAGETFNITLEGLTTTTIAYSAVAGTMAAALQAALEALGNIGAGGVTVTNIATDTYSVEFIAQNRAQDVGELAPVSVNTAAGGVFSATLTQGVAGGEAVISDARGWPACGAFYQSRLLMGGLRSRPQTVIGSRLGDYFNFDTKGAKANAALDEDLDTDQVTTITALYPGRHLQILTSSAEFFVPAEPITPPTAIKKTTARGVQPGTPQAFMDTSTVFVSRGGDGLVQFSFDQIQGSYSADYLNLLAPHLVKGVIDMAFRASRGPGETDFALLARDDGMGVAMIALPAQDVTAFSRWTTNGLFLAGVADLAGEIHVAVQRPAEGGTDVYLERLDAAAMLDSQVAATVDVDPITQISVPHLEGQTVTLYVDGADAGDVIVADGLAVLPHPALREVAAGCLFQPKFISLPFALQDDPRPLAELAEKIGQIALQLGPTVNLKAGINGHRLWTVPLRRRAGSTLDTGAGDQPFSGWTKVSDIPGFTEDGQVRWVQDRPGPLSVKQLVVTVDT